MNKDEALRLALEALETLTDCYDNNAVGIEIDAIKAIKEALETKDEPVAWEQFYPDIGKPQIAFNAEVVGYVAPQSTWVGLTDEDLKLLSAEWRIVYGAWMDDFARDIEAKLKEKNT